MKNFKNSIKDTLTKKYSQLNITRSSNMSTDINILLNRVKLNQKNEIKKKFIFLQWYLQD